MKYPMRMQDTFSIALGALGITTTVSTTTRIDGDRLQGCIPRKIGFQVTWSNKTINAGNGPFICGLAVGLSNTEIAAYFAADPQRQDDPDTVEQSQRPVMILDIAPLAEASMLSHHPWQWVDWPGWHIREGVELDFFVFNNNIAAADTGCIVTPTLQILGDWLDD